MSKVSHSPGPWKIVQESVDPEWHIITAPGGRIMVNIHIEPRNPMDAANAALIQSAPDLLRGCQAAMAYLADPPSEFPENRAEAVAIIRAALAKAGQA